MSPNNRCTWGACRQKPDQLAEYGYRSYRKGYRENPIRYGVRQWLLHLMHCRRSKGVSLQCVLCSRKKRRQVYWWHRHCSRDETTVYASVVRTGNVPEGPLHQIMNGFGGKRSCAKSPQRAHRTTAALGADSKIWRAMGQVH